MDEPKDTQIRECRDVWMESMTRGKGKLGGLGSLLDK